MSAGVYVHLPFCPYICPYCDFAKWPYRRSAMERYLEALRAEIAAAPQVSASTLFFGGGTPNAIPASRIVELIDILRKRFNLPAGAEITLEANPEPELCEDFAAYRSAGVTRLSLGVQSFEDGELRVLGRRHTAADVAVAVRRARDAGFDDLSLDLIFGVPGQTPSSWEASVRAAIDLRPDHISTYGLTIESGTPYAQWHEREPQAFASNDLEAEQYRIAIEQLQRAGFEQYEISNFARPGHRCFHNLNYWKNGDYLGLGVGAASYLDGVRKVHTRDLEAYISAAMAGEPIPGDAERLLGAARAGEAAMLALRTGEGVELDSFRERYGIDFLSSYERPIQELKSAGMLEVTPTHVRLTSAGRFMANDVCGEFITQT